MHVIVPAPEICGSRCETQVSTMLETQALRSGHDHDRTHKTSFHFSAGEPCRSKSSLARYLEGWAEADPAKIAGATAQDYDFHDPLIGHFSRRTLPQYFGLLRSQLGIAGLTATRDDLAFTLRGPVASAPRRANCQQYWREAPRLGLTGIAEITLRDGYVAAETVTYDLNMACEALRATNLQPGHVLCCGA
jgi:hypothetical protein